MPDRAERCLSGIEKFDKLDEFDLNEYIKAIRFDEMKVPALLSFSFLNKSYFLASRK